MRLDGIGLWLTSWLLTLALLSPAGVVRTLAATTKDEAAKASIDDNASDPAEEEEGYYELLQLFVDALDQVERNYVKDLSRRELVEAAIQGMLAKLDQHTSYIAPEDLERFRSGVESEFGGIGIKISRENDQLIIISPLIGTPAYRAGLMAGDVITHIGSKPTKGMSLDETVKRLKGKIGTKVTLSVLHLGDHTNETVTLTREMVRVHTVLGDRRKGDDSWQFMFDEENRIGYVRVVAFGRHTSNELRRALEELTSQGLQGLILDLRFNPGGLLTSAVEVSDLFIDDGRIVSTSGRNVTEQKWDAHQRGTFDGFPLAVLVNQYSASASEIVAACLQDHGRAIVVGQRTFGKGSVQNIIELEEGRMLSKLTTAGYLRPNGKNIDRRPDADQGDDWGVRPDDGFEIILSEARSRRLDSMRRARDVLKPTEDDETEEDEETDGEGPADPQRAKALAYLQEQIHPAKDDVVAEGSSSVTPPGDR